MKKKRYLHKFISNSFVFVFMVAVTFSMGSSRQALAAVKYVSLQTGVFAKLSDKVISLSEFESALKAAVRQKTYHGKIPQEQIEKVRQETGRSLIVRELLLQEAQRSKISPDKKWVKSIIAGYEQRYSGSDDWKAKRDDVLPKLVHYLEQESLIQKLQSTVQNIQVPSDSRVREYYERHPDKFTRPDRYRVSTILLKVDASAPLASWDAAEEEAMRLLEKIRKGKSFSELARLHSADSSAQQGGDMGFLHKGMLALPVQKLIQTLELGEISEPVRLLQGVGIFRLDERQSAKLNKYETVRDRARDLWLRDQRKHVWKSLIERLWEKTEISVNKEHLVPI